VIEELRLGHDLLTHSQKRIADYIVDHSRAIAFSTVDEMAARLGVNPSTIVRFCYRLGLNGFFRFTGVYAPSRSRPVVARPRTD